MNEQPKGRTLSKQRLEIANIEMDIPYSQGTKQLDRVHAVNLSLAEGAPLFGKTLRYTVFNAELKTFVRGKNGIVADVEERPRPESEYGPDRTIVQVYDDEGKPVSQKKGGPGGFPRRSLEDDLALEAFKRVSIEGQTAVAQVGEFLRNPQALTTTLTDEQMNRILEKYWKAVEKGLDNYLAERPAPRQAAKPAPAGPGNAPGSRQDVKSAAPKPDQVSSDQVKPEPRLFKNFGELLTLAGKLKPPVTRAELLGALKLKEGQAPTDLNAAWLKAEELSLAKKPPVKPISNPEKLFE